MILHIKADNLEVLVEEIAFENVYEQSIQYTFQIKIITLFTTTLFYHNRCWISWEELVKTRTLLKKMLDENGSQKVTFGQFPNGIVLAFSKAPDGMSAMMEVTVDTKHDLHMHSSGKGSVDILNILYHQLSDFVLTNGDQFH
jgi:hypothetical protein